MRFNPGGSKEQKSPSPAEIEILDMSPKSSAEVYTTIKVRAVATLRHEEAIASSLYTGTSLVYVSKPCVNSSPVFYCKFVTINRLSFSHKY